MLDYEGGHIWIWLTTFHKLKPKPLKLGCLAGGFWEVWSLGFASHGILDCLVGFASHEVQDLILSYESKATPPMPPGQ